MKKNLPVISDLSAAQTAAEIVDLSESLTAAAATVATALSLEDRRKALDLLVTRHQQIAECIATLEGGASRQALGAS